MPELTGRLFDDAKTVYDFLSDVPTTDRADLILAAGSHDLRVAEHAAKLYLSGAAPLIICSGGYGKMTAGTFPKPEAVLFAERCAALGVPEDVLLIEDRSTNTGENIQFSKALVETKGLSPSSIIGVCKPYMAKRVWATGRKQWSAVRWYLSTPALSFEDYPCKAAPLESTMQLMVGDLQRCRVYAELGYQVTVEIPEAVWEAGRRLAEAGFDQQVIGQY